MKMKLLTASQTGKLTMVSFVVRLAFALLTTGTFAKTTLVSGSPTTQIVTLLSHLSLSSLGSSIRLAVNGQRLSLTRQTDSCTLGMKT